MREYPDCKRQILQAPKETFRNLGVCFWKCVHAFLTVSRLVSVGKRGDRTPVDKPGHILGYEPRAKGIPHTRISAKAGCSGSCVSASVSCFELCTVFGDGIERIDGLPNQPLGQIVLRQHGNQVFHTSVNLSGLAAAEIVAVLPALFAVTLCENGLTHGTHNPYHACFLKHQFLPRSLLDAPNVDLIGDRFFHHCRFNLFDDTDAPDQAQPPRQGG